RGARRRLRPGRAVAAIADQLSPRTAPAASDPAPRQPLRHAAAEAARACTGPAFGAGASRGGACRRSKAFGANPADPTDAGSAGLQLGHDGLSGSTLGLPLPAGRGRISLQMTSG